MLFCAFTKGADGFDFYLLILVFTLWWEENRQRERFMNGTVASPTVRADCLKPTNLCGSTHDGARGHHAVGQRAAPGWEPGGKSACCLLCEFFPW